ncbi:hypothetical protein OV142_36120 [Nannocystis sp. SCPEA4]|nr:hypothetical protein [Nannocystis sp. SCPEA4]MCY1060571.1 hypothetical protein [Nannocystis sp. SCPEA4]
MLSHTQIEAPRRQRAGTDAERLTRIVFTTIGGIAAGLQTSSFGPWTPADFARTSNSGCFFCAA